MDQVLHKNALIWEKRTSCSRDSSLHLTQAISAYYETKSGYGKPTALLLFQLAHSLQREDNFQIWWVPPPRPSLPESHVEGDRPVQELGALPCSPARLAHLTHPPPTS